MNTSNTRSKSAKRLGLSDLAVKATRALAKAQRQVIRENSRYGLPLIVFQDGRIVAIPTGKSA